MSAGFLFGNFSTSRGSRRASGSGERLWIERETPHDSLISSRGLSGAAERYKRGTRSARRRSSVAKEERERERKRGQGDTMASASSGGDKSDGPRTLWMGDLAYWMDETILLSLFANTGEVLSAKIIRNKMTGYSEGYGFIEFASNFAAQKVLQTYNGAPIPGTDQFFRLNWASHSSRGGSGAGSHSSGGKEESDNSEHSVFVGDLSPEVTDFALQEFFRQFYPSVKSARVVTDPVTGRPKGYGFVRFISEADRDKAMVEMSGQVVGSRPIRVSLATPKRSGGGGGSSYQGAPPFHRAPMGLQFPGMVPRPGMEIHAGPSTANRTLYIGSIAPDTVEDDIRQVFAPFGEIVYVKIALAKACAFVQYRERECAERALVATNGQLIKGNAVRVSWGRHSEPHQSRGVMAQGGAYPQAGYYTTGYYYDPNQYYGYGVGGLPAMQSPLGAPGSPPMVSLAGSPPTLLHQMGAMMAQAPASSPLSPTTAPLSSGTAPGMGAPPVAKDAKPKGGTESREASATEPASVEEMNKDYSAISAPYTVESNSFLSSLHQHGV